MRILSALREVLSDVKAWYQDLMLYNMPELMLLCASCSMIVAAVQLYMLLHWDARIIVGVRCIDQIMRGPMV